MTLLVIDPNVLLAAALDDTNAIALLREISQRYEYVTLGLDDEDAIRTAYSDLASYLREDQQVLLNAIDRGTFNIVSLSAEKAARHKDFLQSLGCGTPVEPHLVAIASDDQSNVRLIIAGSEQIHSAWRSRGLHQQSVRIAVTGEPDFQRLNVTEVFDAYRRFPTWLEHDPPYPGTRRELEDFLRDNRYQESQQLEFKQPHDQNNEPTDQYLTPGVIADAAKAVCALSNSYGGKVIIGVAEKANNKGELMGFRMVYKKDNEFKPKSQDEMARVVVTAFQNYLSPTFLPEELRPFFVPTDSDRSVLVLHVVKCSRTHYFKGGKYVRHATSTVKVN
jgi:hypothetical protein